MLTYTWAYAWLGESMPDRIAASIYYSLMELNATPQIDTENLQLL